MSALALAAQDYLALRRSLGHDLADSPRLLPRFVAYLDATGTPTVTITAALAWAQQPDADPGTTVWLRRMTVARGFARHLADIDPATEVPPLGLLPSGNAGVPRSSTFRPNIDALMRRAHQSIGSPLRAVTFETLIRLLAVTGMRVRESHQARPF